MDWQVLTPPQSLVRQFWKRYAVYVLLLLANLAWGGSFVVARTLLADSNPEAATLTPTMLATVRFLIASVVLLPVLLHQHRHAQPVRLADVPLFLFLGQLAISAYYWLQYTGVQLTNASISAVLVVGLIPPGTAVFSAFLLREPFGRRKMVALVCGAVGIVVVASQKDLQLALETNFLFGAACLVADAACLAFYSPLLRRLGARYSALTTTSAVTIAGTAGLLLVSLVSDDWSSLAAISSAQWIGILYLALICSIMSYAFYNYALSKLEASKAASWVYVDLLSAVALAALFLGETITPQTAFGGLVILIGLYLVQKA
jgi:drug/metabolite transporter (DMT)-like permease